MMQGLTRQLRRSASGFPRNTLGALAPLPSDPFADVSRATQQLDAVPFMRGEEAHHREIHECRLRQVEHEPGTVPLHLRLQLDEVILLDAPTELERRRLSVGGDFDLESHRYRRWQTPRHD